ncbi:MAG TPA: carboxypeptidase regulatory-like domain-containing protein [Flavisolibacter sp.]|nr:carboxypeptidase regulatory-like domain-containing protein [Flavisolibacter sp.]
MLKRILYLLICILTIGQANAQVTTSSITGFVKADNGNPLQGATITAIHQPTGTQYVTIAKKDGSFTLPNTRVGGPYTITVGFVGFTTKTIENVTLNLGEPYVADVTMSTQSSSLNEVIVTTTSKSRARTGASTNINSRTLTTLPTISRSITDFTRLTPQANGNGFGGRDPRYNNVTIDGANLNNNFGLNNDPLPGGGSNPISLDAIEEITVNIAPYDVRQGNFTGANIAAVTKSGTNTFHGSAYGFYRNQSFNGTNVAGYKLPNNPKSYNKVIGGTLGGPIIKNKLFFFVNGEYEEKSSVLNYYSPTGNGNPSKVSVDSLKAVYDYLTSKFNYDPGPYDNFNPNAPVKNHKLLGKIDWNISTATKLTVKYSDFSNSQSFLPSSSGGINGANGYFTPGAKFSATAMAFGNTIYTQVDKVRSGSFDLTSNIHGRFSNQFLATMTRINTTKGHPGAQFPFVDILDASTGSKNNYISFGNEPFNGNYNVVLNDIYTATDNFSYYAGKHTLTAGLTYEFQKVGNGFMAGSQGYYVFKSVNDFINNKAPLLYSQTYSLVPGQDAVISANLKVGQAGAYIQDEYNVNNNFRLTAGLRVDKPIYPEQPLANNAVNNQTLYDQDGNLVHYNTGAWPKSTLYWSPRVGFHWNLPEQKLVVRGGTGLFTGRIPFVYLTNLPTGVGPYQYGVLVSSAAPSNTNMSSYLFNPDPHAYNPFYNKNLPASVFPTTGGTVVPNGAYALIDNNFKFPQVWRSDLAVERNLGQGFTVSIEGIYTKDVNSVYMFNANQNKTDATVDVGGSTRPAFSAAAARKLNAKSGNAVVLANSDQGHSFSLTTQLTKSFSKGFFGTLAYTYTSAYDLTANPGSQAGSVWSINPTSGTQNTQELSVSSFAVPHRVIAGLSYRFEYAKHLATTISAFYEGAPQGTLSYIYNGDVNNDGNSADLMYIPKNPSEITFVDLPASGTRPAFTAKQQQDAFFKFIAQDKYLSKHMGEVAKRNAAVQPWYNKLDLKIAQDLFTNISGRKHNLQITADILNALNLINHNWGVKSFYVVNNPLAVKGIVNGKETYQLATYLPQGATQQVLLDRTYINNNSLSSTWALQLGLRYSF